MRSTSCDKRLDIVRRFIEAGWNAGSGEPVGDIVADDYESNDGGFFVPTRGPGGFRRLTGAEAVSRHIGMYQAIYDGLTFTVERMTVDDDTVTTVWTPAGTTREGTFTDRSGRERPFELRGEGVSRTAVVDGKVTRHDMFWARDPVSP
jgi:hypothetical protein